MIEIKSTNIKRSIYFFAALVIFSIFESSCNKGKNIPDVSHIDINLNIIRYEQEMYNLDSSEIKEKAILLKKQHPAFTEIYTSIMRERDQRDSSDTYILEWLMQGSQLKSLYDTCQVQYQDFKEYEKQLTQAFQYYQYYFPENKIPKVYTCLTEFAYQGFTYGNDILGIGVEHYMGKDFPAYKAIFPQYQYSTFTPEHLISSTIEVFAGEIIGDYKETKLLDAMIQNGKKLYIKDLLLPHTPDSIKFQYTSAQTQWCYDNENLIYRFFLEHDKLYNKNKREYMQYMLPGPHSPGMPPEAPGRTANFIGLQIIKQYMKKNKGMTLQELIDNKNSQNILKESQYSFRE